MCFFMWNPGAVPHIHFQDVTNNIVYKFTGRPFSLTATVVSDLNLTSLYWSPPEYVGPLPNKTATVRHGNITTTTFTSLKNASLNDSGNYTLTAVNECGQSSLQVYVDFLTGKLIDYYRFVLSILPVEHCMQGIHKRHSLYKELTNSQGK